MKLPRTATGTDLAAWGPHGPRHQDGVEAYGDRRLMLGVLALAFPKEPTVSDEAWAYYAIDAMLSGWTAPRSSKAETLVGDYMAKVKDMRTADNSASNDGAASDDEDDEAENDNPATGTRRRRRTTNSGGTLKPLLASDVVGRLQRSMEATMAAAAAKRRALTVPAPASAAPAASGTA